MPIHAPASSRFYDKLQRQLFGLAFQPIVSSSNTQQTLYHEGLLRYLGDDLGFDPIEILEHEQAIRALDHSVVSGVIDALRQDERVVLGCNVSAQSALIDQHWERIAETFAEQPSLASRLVVEITESAQVPDQQGLIAFVSFLQDTGARVAIDDFGAGFFTWELLVNARPDIIKIDRSHVSRARSGGRYAAALKDTIARCAEVAPCVVVEGIETPADRDNASNGRGEWLQGYLFGKPQLRSPNGNLLRLRSVDLAPDTRIQVRAR